jgi:4-amino-4-deoxy-L-arabinose transferase-like glycosyltransferase
MTPDDDPASRAPLAADHPLHAISMPSEEQAWRLE